MTFDGPGIRTVVFMKGCPLRCLWCNNPQTWQRLPDGILAGAPLNDGISPTQGRDMSSPTAAMNSVAKLHQALSGEENLQRLADMIKT
jgi:pyruvate formate lyase activating enzyme